MISNCSKSCMLTLSIYLFCGLDNFAQNDKKTYLVNCLTIERQESQKDKNKIEKLKLEVSVKDEKQKAIESAKVTIIFNDVTDSANTDKKGRANFSDITRGNITVRVVAKGYKINTADYDLQQKQNSIEITLEKSQD